VRVDNINIDMKKENEDREGTDIYPVLRDRIALLEYEPGEVLQEEELVEEFSCSRTPVRKAFIRLEDRGFIKRVPKKGTYVSPIDCHSLKGHFQIRKYLLKLVAKQVVQNITEEDLDRLEAIVREMSEEKDPRKLVRFDLEFHRAVYEATHNSLLEQIMGLVLIKTFRIWLFLSGRMLPANASEDFSRLVEALEERDEEKVEEILVDHSQQAVRNMRQELEGI
jgi:DNA-binding GntR family transcriptional regulator